MLREKQTKKAVSIHTGVSVIIRGTKTNNYMKLNPTDLITEY